MTLYEIWVFTYEQLLGVGNYTMVQGIMDIAFTIIVGVMGMFLLGTPLVFTIWVYNFFKDLLRGF